MAVAKLVCRLLYRAFTPRLRMIELTVLRQYHAGCCNSYSGNVCTVSVGLASIPRRRIALFPVMSHSQGERKRVSCWQCQTPVFLEKEKFACDKCKALLPPEANLDYFSVFGFDETFDINVADLAAKFKTLQKVFHPDKFGNKSQKEQEYSAYYSSQINKAYQILLEPLSRGLYVLELNGKPFEEKVIDVEQTFLNEIMEINENVAEASSLEEVGIMTHENNKQMEKLCSEASEAFKQRNWDDAKNILAKLKYYDTIDEKLKEKSMELQLKA